MTKHDLGGEWREVPIYDRDVLSAGTPVSALELNENEGRILAEARFLTLKPVLYLANVSESDAATAERACLRRCRRGVRALDRVLPRGGLLGR